MKLKVTEIKKGLKANQWDLGLFRVRAIILDLIGVDSNMLDSVVSEIFYFKDNIQSFFYF